MQQYKKIRLASSNANLINLNLNYYETCSSHQLNQPHYRADASFITLFLKLNYYEKSSVEKRFYYDTTISLCCNLASSFLLMLIVKIPSLYSAVMLSPSAESGKLNDLANEL